ncbi:DNA-processing protein DprA, partial [Ammoniphilus sp. CFH 90114]|uniref:DNA-processing protein DprA n=1 Tax=Ammoniphilus sp. CFH 90114 TaxID=2493665 RepID=UPI0010251E65
MIANLDDLLYWIWLTDIPSVGPVMQRKLLHRFGTPEAIFQAHESELAEVSGVGPHLANRIRLSRSLEKAKKGLDHMQHKQIQLLTVKDPLYPHEFNMISKAPLVFYYRGYLRGNSVGVGIVGTTRCSEYGKRVAVHAAETFAQYHIPVISGLD